MTTALEASIKAMRMWSKVTRQSKKRIVWVNFYANGGALHFDSEMEADTNHLYVRESEYHHNHPRIGNRAYQVEIEE